MVNCQMVDAIMKKTYISPSVDVVAVNMVGMIAQSIGNGTTLFEGAQNADDDEYGDVKSDKGWDLFD